MRLAQTRLAGFHSRGPRPRSEWFIDDFDPVKLKDFYINGCVNIVPALTALAKVYFSDPGQLTELCII